MVENKRLNKAISETGYCSRRAADKLIENGKVKVNGATAGLGVKVTQNDTITVNEQVITKEVKNIYWPSTNQLGLPAPQI